MCAFSTTNQRRGRFFTLNFIFFCCAFGDFLDLFYLLTTVMMRNSDYTNENISRSPSPSLSMVYRSSIKVEEEKVEEEINSMVVRPNQLLRAPTDSKNADATSSMIYRPKPIRADEDVIYRQKIMEVGSSRDMDDDKSISVKEYLINNYPPNSRGQSSSVERYAEVSFDHANMVPPLSKSPFSNSTEHISMVPPLSKSPFYSSSGQQDQYDENMISSIESMQDDAELKKVRRRMKNKISAQESRRRKKEYVDMLEHRLKQKDNEKDLLQQRVTELEEKIRALVDELFIQKRLGQQPPPLHQAKKVAQVSKASQTGTCLSCFRENIIGPLHSPNECDRSPAQPPPPLTKSLSPLKDTLTIVENIPQFAPTFVVPNKPFVGSDPAPTFLPKKTFVETDPAPSFVLPKETIPEVNPVPSFVPKQTFVESDPVPAMKPYSSFTNPNTFTVTPSISTQAVDVSAMISFQVDSAFKSHEEPMPENFNTAVKPHVNNDLPTIQPHKSDTKSFNGLRLETSTVSGFKEVSDLKRKSIDSILERKFSKHLFKPSKQLEDEGDQAENLPSMSDSLFAQLSYADHNSSPSHT